MPISEQIWQTSLKLINLCILQLFSAHRAEVYLFFVFYVILPLVNTSTRMSLIFFLQEHFNWCLLASLLEFTPFLINLIFYVVIRIMLKFRLRNSGSTKFRNVLFHLPGFVVIRWFSLNSKILEKQINQIFFLKKLKFHLKTKSKK